MGYTLRHANTFICTPAHGGRAGHAGDRPPVRVRLYCPALSHPPRQRRGAVDDHHCTHAARHRPHGAQCAACIPPAQSRGVAAVIVAATHHGDDLRYGDLRGASGAVAPESPNLRQAHQPLDAGAGRRGERCRGADATTGQRRSDSGGPAPARRVLEARQTLEHQSRSRVCAKKKRRDQLIPRVNTRPTWALGFGDEVWWSRLAQPNQHGWTEPEAPASSRSSRAPRTMPSPRPWPGMVCGCAQGRSRRIRCGGALSRGVP